MRKTRIDKKDQSNSQPSGCRFRKRQPTVLFLMTCLVCSVSNAGTLKLYRPSKDQAGALRLAQVMQTATREEILKNTILREHARASIIKYPNFGIAILVSIQQLCLLCHSFLSRPR